MEKNMRRISRISPDGKNHFVECTNIENSGEHYSGNAIERLARFEDFHEHLLEQRQKIPLDLERLRVEGKSKSYKFKELLGQKLLTETILNSLSRFGID